MIIEHEFLQFLYFGAESQYLKLKLQYNILWAQLPCPNDQKLQLPHDLKLHNRKYFNTSYKCATKMCLVSFSENLFSAGKIQNRILFSNRRVQKIFQHINSGEFYFNMNYPLNSVQLEPYLLVNIQTSASKHNKKRRLKLYKTILAIIII